MKTGRGIQTNRLIQAGVAVFSVALALGLALLLSPWLYPSVTPLFFVAVLISAWVGGSIAGLLATVLSTSAVGYFIEPYALHLANVGTVVQLTTFAIASGLISWLNRSRSSALETEENYRALFNSIDEGYFLIDVLFDEHNQPVDLLYLDANPAATRIVGQDFTGRSLKEIDPHYEAYWYEIFGRVAQTGMGERLERYAEPDRKWYDFYISKVGQVNSRRIAVVFQDITERKRRELNTAFLDEISQALSHLSTPDEIMQTVGARLGEFLQLSGCFFADVNEAQNEVTVHHGWAAADVPSLKQTFRLEDYLTDEFSRANRAGEPVIILDTAHDERTDAENYARLKIGSFVTVPFHRHGRWIGHTAVTKVDPYEWRVDEIELLQEISSRIFPRIERARAEIALSESEAKYRTLFESIDEGFALAEVIYDSSGQPIDILYLEANPAASRLTGVADYAQRRMSEISPAFEPYWVELYDRVARSGVSERNEQYAAPLKRWYDFYVFRDGAVAEAVGSRRVAVIFQDITARKRAEEASQRAAEMAAFRVMLADALRSLTDPIEIQYQAACALGEYLRANRVGYAEDQGDGETVVVTRNYTNGVSGIEGRYHYDDYGPELLREFRAGNTVVRPDIANNPLLTEAEKAAHQVLQLGSTVNVPLVKGGRLVAILFVHYQEAHAWSADELALVEEVAERIWATVEQSRAEAALQASHETFRYLVDNSPFGVYVVDADFRLMQVSAGAQKVFANVRPLIRRDFAEVLRIVWQEPFASEAIALFQHTLNTGEPYHSPSTVERRSDVDEIESYDWKIERISLPDGRFGVVCHFYDLSERQRYEAELRESEERFRNLADNAPVMVWVTDATGFCTYLSQGWYNLTGQTEETGLGFGWLDRTHPDDRERAERAFLEATQRQEAFQLEYRLQNKDGDYIWAIDAASPWFGVEGQFKGYIGSVIDISDRKQTEDEREQLLQREQVARETAEQANRIKDEFLAVLSHELRSPLNPILGWSKLLQQGNLNPAKTQQAIKTIERNAQLQSELIEDLLDVSRILQGKLSLTVSQVNLGTVIRSAMETVRLAAEAKGIEVRSELPDSSPLQVMGDATRLQQVVWNLLSNAVKFTTSSGRVDVRLAQVDSQAHITITDTGKGIAPDFLPHVFDYFQQEDGATTRKFGGLGLGLAIVKQIVELHGGTVTAESQGEGQGATFTVRLPLLGSRESGVGSRGDFDAPLPTLSFPLTGLQILVVDDTADSRDFIAFVIEQAGATVSVAESGAAAIAMLLHSRFDVLVSDVGMPEMDGYMLMRQVRSLPLEQNGQVKAIALTAYAGDFNQQQALQAGFQQHLSKPVEPERLIQAIVSLLKINALGTSEG